MITMVAIYMSKWNTTCSKLPSQISSQLMKNCLRYEGKNKKVKLTPDILGSFVPSVLKEPKKDWAEEIQWPRLCPLAAMSACDQRVKRTEKDRAEAIQWPRLCPLAAMSETVWNYIPITYWSITKVFSQLLFSCYSIVSDLQEKKMAKSIVNNMHYLPFDVKVGINSYNKYIVWPTRFKRDSRENHTALWLFSARFRPRIEGAQNIPTSYYLTPVFFDIEF